MRGEAAPNIVTPLGLLIWNVLRVDSLQAGSFLHVPPE